jgi:hypothetical protein
MQTKIITFLFAGFVTILATAVIIAAKFNSKLN